MRRRTGVVLCGCKGRVSGVIRLGVVRKFLEARGAAAVVEMDAACETPGEVFDFIRRNKLDSLVAAGCSPEYRGFVFKDAAFRAGLAPLSVEFASIREQCALPHSDNPEAATEKAKLLTLAKLMRLASLEEVPYELLKTGAVRPKVSRRELLLLGIGALRRYDVVPRADGAGFCTLCKRCANACPRSAVRVTLNGVSVGKERCVSCGLCVRACPFGFVQLPTFGLKQFSSEIEGLADGGADLSPRVVVLACDVVYRMFDELSNKRYDPGVLVVRLPCAGAVTVAHLLRAIEVGADAVAVACASDCLRGLDVEAVRESTARIVAAAADILGALGVGGERVELLRVDGNALLPSIARLVERAKSAGPTPLRGREPTPAPEPPLEAAEIVKGMAGALGVKDASVSGDHLPFGFVTVDSSKCTACKVCTLCPTGAIKVSEGGEYVALSFTYSNCVGCRLCASVCPEQAISVDNKLDLRELLAAREVEVHREGVARCKRCGKPFASEALVKRVMETYLSAKLVEDFGPELWEYCNDCRPVVALERALKSGSLKEVGEGG